MNPATSPLAGEHREMYVGWAPLGAALLVALDDLASAGKGAALPVEDRRRFVRLGKLLAAASRGAAAFGDDGRNGVLSAREEARQTHSQNLAADAADLPPFDTDILLYKLVSELVQLEPEQIIDVRQVLSQVTPVVVQLAESGRLTEAEEAPLHTYLQPMLEALAHVNERPWPEDRQV